MSATPPLSIGLPVYNGADYLEQSVDALLGQTFGDFELILLSNASTDGTDDICRRYEREDERVRFLRQPVNVGAHPRPAGAGGGRPCSSGPPATTSTRGTSSSAASSSCRTGRTSCSPTP